MMFKIVLLFISISLSTSAYSTKLDTTIICRKNTKTCLSFWSFDSKNIKSYWKQRSWHSKSLGHQVLKEPEFNRQISLISKIEKKSKISKDCIPNLTISSSLKTSVEVCDRLLTKSEKVDLGKMLN